MEKYAKLYSDDACVYDFAKLFADADSRIKANNARIAAEEAESLRKAEELKEAAARARKEKNIKLERAILTLIANTLKETQGVTGEIEMVDPVLGQLARKTNDFDYKSYYALDDEGLTIKLNYSRKVFYTGNISKASGKCFFVPDYWEANDKIAFEELKALLAELNIDIDRETHYEDGFTKDILTIKLSRQKRRGQVGQ